MERGELELVLKWAASEGWNPGLHDSDAFYSADPKGHLLGILAGVPVGCISAVAYGISFGFLGLYLVRPEYRGRGLGIMLWEKSLSRLKGRNVGLDGVLGRQRDYEKYGFRLAHRNLRFRVLGNSLPVPSGLTALRRGDLGTVLEYDRQLFPADRRQFLGKWLGLPESAALGCVKGGKLAGYGVMRKCRDGYKVGPLFADTPDMAEDLFTGLAGHAQGAQVFIDIPEVNKPALNIAARMEMEQVFATARMYSMSKPDVDSGRIYGVTTLELG
jgi:GNAT superfamily N-acetyltransferase